MPPRRRPAATACAACAALCARGGDAAAALPAQSWNMSLVGVDALQGRPAYQPTIVQQAGRWVAYVGHHSGEALNPLTRRVEPHGTSVVDVTDPASPQYLHHIPGGPAAQMVQVCPGDALPAGPPGLRGRHFLLRTNGTAEHQVWDVTTPDAPRLVSTPSSGLRDTHKSWWECDTGIAYLISGPPGWRTTRMLQVFNLSDPARPRLIRNYGLPGQAPNSSVPADCKGARVETTLHEAVSHAGRLYLGWGATGVGVLQILNRTALLRGDPAVPAAGRLAPTTAALEYPQIGRVEMPEWLGGHTAFPLLGMRIPGLERDGEGSVRDVVFLTSEEGRQECAGFRKFVSIVDITDPAHPWAVARYGVAEDSAEPGYCARGGRFGPHGCQWSSLTRPGDPYLRKVMFVSYFNAGARAVDVTDPFTPREVGYYVPAATEFTEPDASGKRAVQTNNVEVDGRGLLYLVDRAGTGMNIVRPGAAGAAAPRPPRKGGGDEGCAQRALLEPGAALALAAAAAALAACAGAAAAGGCRRRGRNPLRADDAMGRMPRKAEELRLVIA